MKGEICSCSRLTGTCLTAAMIKLLVIADDFTGALDTGVQFKTKGVLVRVGAGGLKDIGELPDSVQVLIIDSESRHLSPAKAYDVIYEIVKEAVAAGVPVIYKKTDSGLRGNIGAELSAALSASGQKRMHFLPAYPRIGRITRNGCHYIDGQPVSESVFGKDPFEPVLHSYIPDILREQSKVRSIVVSQDTVTAEEGVLIYDSEKTEDMERIAERLKENGQLRLLAGCAGFASVLRDILGMEQDADQNAVIWEDLFVVCGSVNRVTLSQMDYAQEQGALRIGMHLTEKMETEWMDTRQGKEKLQQWKHKVEGASVAILESASDLDSETVSQYAKRKGITNEQLCYQIADVLGGILKRMVDLGLRRTLLITGGDTLMSFMKKIGVNELSPVCEVAPGSVLNRISYRGSCYSIISKSGGFGEKTLFMEIKDIISRNQKGKS